MQMIHGFMVIMKLMNMEMWHRKVKVIDMKIETIYKDDKKVVKAVWYAGKFLYTRTYFLDEGGLCKSSVTVFENGNVTTTGVVSIIQDL